MSHWRVAAAITLAVLARASGAGAQDTTASYPWRASYFPYLTASPNDGVMAMGRVVLFQQSRWDARTSIDRQVAFEGGYSTHDSWLLRARTDLPALADGWRLQALAEAGHQAQYLDPASGSGVAANRQMVSADLSRRLARHLWLALRAEGMHLAVPLTSAPDVTETDIRGRLALVYDARDREYAPQSGALIQAGVLGGSAGTGYAGDYIMVGEWFHLGPQTHLVAHLALRDIEETTIDAARIIPGWEDEITVGGPESNRSVPIGVYASRSVRLGSLELDQTLKAFPGGAIGVLAFADGTDVVGGDNTPAQGGMGIQPLIVSTNYPTGVHVGGGGGLTLRLLRNAIFTATIGRSTYGTAFYLSGGWGW